MDDQFNQALITSHEGKLLRVYSDTLGIHTIGIGFNLMQPGAEAICQQVGLHVHELLSGMPITSSECDALFSIQYGNAKAAALKMFPDLDTYPRNAAAVICDMMFQLGAHVFSEFTHTIASFKAGDWEAAGMNIEASSLAHQTPNRVADNVKLLQAIEE